MEDNKENKESTSPTTGFTDVFLSKLKEQSFVIILMLGVIYYQHRLMEFGKQNTIRKRLTLSRQ